MDTGTTNVTPLRANSVDLLIWDGEHYEAVLFVPIEERMGYHYVVYGRDEQDLRDNTRRLAISDRFVLLKTSEIGRDC